MTLSIRQPFAEAQTIKQDRQPSTTQLWPSKDIAYVFLQTDSGTAQHLPNPLDEKNLTLERFQCQAISLHDSGLNSYPNDRIQNHFESTCELLLEILLVSPHMSAHCQQQAAILFNLIPPAIAPDFLEDYGLTVSREQAQSITWEIVLLSTYWIHCALQAGIPEQVGKDLWEQIERQLKERWESRFGFVHRPINQFFSDLETRTEAWNAIAAQGGEPIIILTETASDMESKGLVSRGEKPKLLVFLLDLVPIVEIGQMAAEIEQGMSSDSLPF